MLSIVKLTVTFHLLLCWVSWRLARNKHPSLLVQWRRKNTFSYASISPATSSTSRSSTSAVSTRRDGRRTPFNIPTMNPCSQMTRRQVTVTKFVIAYLVPSIPSLDRLLLILKTLFAFLQNELP